MSALKQQHPLSIVSYAVMTAYGTVDAFALAGSRMKRCLYGRCGTLVAVKQAFNLLTCMHYKHRTNCSGCRCPFSLSQPRFLVNTNALCYRPIPKPLGIMAGTVPCPECWGNPKVHLYGANLEDVLNLSLPWDFKV